MEFYMVFLSVRIDGHDSFPRFQKLNSACIVGLLASREREISELKAKVTEVLAVMPSMNEPSQLGHNMAIGDMGSHHGLSMSSLSMHIHFYIFTCSKYKFVEHLLLLSSVTVITFKK